MAGMGSYGVAISGLNAARSGLNVIGHNISNSDTVGYTRQQVLQNDFVSSTVGQNAVGYMQIGLGTNVSAIRQIRDKFLDVSYREEVGRTGFYDVKYAAGVNIETIIGELQGQYNFQTVLSGMWDSLNELSTNPEGLAARQSFMAMSQVFVDKINNVSTRLREEQDNLNEQVKETVNRTNALLTTIAEMNKLIPLSEATGDNANDFRDTRNNALDELAMLIPIQYKELPDKTVTVMCEGNELVTRGSSRNIGLRYCSATQNFVEPVLTNSMKILDYDPTDSNATPLFKMMDKNNYYKTVDSISRNDEGKLRGLLVARGNGIANYTMTPGEIQKEIDFYTPLANALKKGPLEATAAYKARLLAYQATIQPSITASDTAIANYENIITTKNGIIETKNQEIAGYETAIEGYKQVIATQTLILNDPSKTAADKATAQGIIDARNSDIATAVNAANIAKGLRDQAIEDKKQPIIDRGLELLNRANLQKQFDAGNIRLPGENISQAEYELGEAQKAYWNVNNGLIPKTQMQFDTLVNSVITMINDVVAPKDTTDPNSAPHGIDADKSQFIPVFVRGNKTFTMDRYDSFGNVIEEDPENRYTLYSMGNIILNPDIVGAKNYDKIPLSFTGDIGDQNTVMDMLDKWKKGWPTDDPQNIAIDDQESKGVSGYYKRFITGIAIETNEANTHLKSQTERLTQIDNKRKQISGVSMDEEMKNMLIYQHAYNASSRMMNVIDSMIDKIVNGTGRVGI